MKTTKILAYVLAALAVMGGGYGYAYWQSAHEHADKPARRVLYYVDPMHPAYKSDKPGVAPDCGMRLVPVYEEPHVAPVTAGTSAGSPPGEMTPGMIQVSPEKQQLIGVTYAVAEETAEAGSFRAVGRVTADETRIVHIHSRVDGWIEKTHVDFQGALVKKGDPVLTLYSPEMLATEQELLLALRAREAMQRSDLPEASADSDALVKAARMRLELWDLSRPQIDEVERTGDTIRSIALYAPANGFVMARNAFPNQRVTADTELYTLADLSHVWIVADVFEADLDRIGLGQPATISQSYGGGHAFPARVTYIQPQIDPATRTLKVRLEAANPGYAVKPDMFVDVNFRINSPARLTVPSEAVLDSGLHKTVFVDRGNGFLEPRQVETGDTVNDRVEIRSGLEAGERVVASGNFLIDAESQLKAAAAGMGGHQHAHGGGGGKP